MNAPLDQAPHRTLLEATLEDRWTRERGAIYLSGTQALVRLLMLQRQRDLANGLNTAGFLTGYRGSPLGGVDMTATRASAHLERHHVRVRPGVNEALPARAAWLRQQAIVSAGAKYH